jgi:hypothetical protein
VFIKVRSESQHPKLDVKDKVFPVKQEILLSDVTSCFNLLKKAFQELGSKSDEQLQMAQPSARSGLLGRQLHALTRKTILRPGTLTLVAHPMNAYALDFDDLVAVRVVPVQESAPLMTLQGLGRISEHPR